MIYLKVFTKALINDIIRLSELDHSEMPRQYENFDLYEFVKDCAESLQVNAQKQGIRFSYRGSTCMIRGNKDMIRELIDNLVQNAIRYNKEGNWWNRAWPCYCKAYCRTS